MKALAKYTLKTYSKPADADPVHKRRVKLLSAIEQQSAALTAALNGDVLLKPSRKEGQAPKPVRPWFVTREDGVYVECRYGARPMLIDGKNNAVFVAKIEDVAGVLTAFATAVKAGELDKAMAAVSERKSTRPDKAVA
jgi:hypothetical protein